MDKAMNERAIEAAKKIKSEADSFDGVGKLGIFLPKDQWHALVAALAAAERVAGEDGWLAEYLDRHMPAAMRMISERQAEKDTAGANWHGGYWNALATLKDHLAQRPSPIALSPGKGERAKWENATDLQYRIAAIVCEYGCGLISDCRSREVTDALLARFEISQRGDPVSPGKVGEDF